MPAYEMERLDLRAMTLAAAQQNSRRRAVSEPGVLERATCAIGLPDSLTIRIAPARKSGSNLRRTSGTTSPHR